MNFACQFFIGRHPEPERDGQAEYPLAIGCYGQHIIDQVIGFFCHSLAATTGAKSATFARKRHRPLKVAGLAFCAKKTVLKNPAAQITPKLFDDKFRKSLAVSFSLRDEGLDMLGKDLVQDSVFGLSYLVGVNLFLQIAHESEL